MKMTARSHAASELPLEELLALYGYEVLDPLLQSDKDTCQLAASLPDMTLDKDQITKDLFPGEEEEESSADDLTPSVTSNTSELLRRLQGGDKGMLVSSSEEESDDDSNASDASTDGRKDIMVGSMYQAKIPPISPYTYQDRAHDSEDQLLWSPGVLPVHKVEEYLLCAQIPGCQEGAASTRLPGDTIRDNEQALYELVKCNFNAEEALRRIRFNVKVFSEELCAWSEQECRNFEHGYRVYGKNFHLIQANKVRTRSVGEVVEYYYMWKKSDRHEYFTQQATQRLSRRKYNLQSGNMEDGDQDGEVGELIGGGNSQDSSQGTLGAAQLESSSLPPPGLELDKQGGGPSPAETNTTLSLKAMNLVRTGLRKQACPVGRGWRCQSCMLVGVHSSCSGAPSHFSRLWTTPRSLGQAVVPSQTLSCRPSPLLAAPCSPAVAFHPPPRTITSWVLASTSSSYMGLSSQRVPTVVLRGAGMASSPMGCRWTSPCPPPPLPHPLSCPQTLEPTVPFCAPLPSSAPALSHSEEDTRGRNCIPFKMELHSLPFCL